MRYRLINNSGLTPTQRKRARSLCRRGETEEIAIRMAVASRRSSRSPRRRPSVIFKPGEQDARGWKPIVLSFDAPADRFKRQLALVEGELERRVNHLWQYDLEKRSRHCNEMTFNARGACLPDDIRGATNMAPNQNEPSWAEFDAP